ncbi:deoxyribonuclease tatdn2-related [Anaeramoeba ignava]|uniref:Deoxyribonuclease tatdn2-related n=1 Tax=Anaeramoeba ignava TaxID=1746090 RepID=A0A9Q0LVK8_ANAIG|nr:deoxyribonuclease tatdn2-related [Anaeramoeba ignava]
MIFEKDIENKLVEFMEKLKIKACVMGVLDFIIIIFLPKEDQIEAEEDTLKYSKNLFQKEWKFHVHCYTSLEFAENIMKEWPNAYFDLLVTDGPYMAPVPYRGKIAHPGMIPKLLIKLFQLKIQKEKVYSTLVENAKNFINF